MKYVQFSSDKAIISLKEKLDHETASVIIKEINAVVPQGIRYIDFECGELKYVSNAGIRALMFIKQKIEINAEIMIIMRNVSKPVRDVLTLSGIDGYVDFIG